MKNITFKNKKITFSIDLKMTYNQIRNFLNSFYKDSIITLNDIMKIYEDLINIQHFQKEIISEKYWELNYKLNEFSFERKPKKLTIIYN
jgi:hypothetical protein